MSREMARKALRKVRELGCSSVHIGGGEPFLNIEALCGILDTTRECGVLLEYVETNCFWARSIETAVTTLEPLRDHGLQTILVSIDPFHSASVPLCRVENAIAACDRIGMRSFPWQTEFIQEIRRLGTETTHSMSEYETVFGTGYALDVIRRYGMTFGGRVVETCYGRLPRHEADAVINMGAPCSRLVETGHFHIDPHGFYIPGLCTGLAIRLEDISMPGESYPILNLLYGGGIAALYNWACSEHGFEANKSGYMNACHICLDIRSFLVHRSCRFFGELAPSGFYNEIASRFK